MKVCTVCGIVCLALGLVGFFVAFVPRMRLEERALEEQFGEPYRAFERTRRRLIPGLW